MANRKITIDKMSLPLVNSNNKYYLRYRIVLDKTKDSDWSEIAVLSGKPVIEVPGVISSATTAGKEVVTITWDKDNNSPTYDVFLGWDSGNYVYEKSVTTTSYSVIAPDGTSSVDVLVQIGSAQRVVSSVLRVFEGSKNV
jgi:hypothetical protein